VQEAREQVRNALQSSTCLICISSVRRTEATWSCSTCYSGFHLVCIQRWAKDTIFQQKQQLEGDPERAAKERLVCWSCPKCRREVEAAAIPKEYRCYCGKERDPAFDPWQTPHSCGSRCSLPLPGCAHKCSLLCHPGPCPPCPQTVQQACHCGQASPVTRRCSAAPWSCGEECGAVLGCGAHACPATCHPGDCRPCDRTSVQSCECRKTREPRPCSAPQFKCGHPCGALLACGFHSCDLICHPEGPCPPCPLSLDRSCPCGKSTVRLACTEATPTCGDTCGKTLGCESHTCLERCHRGSCPSCLQMAVKQCRCGARKKEVQCAKTFLCEAKCRRTRDCQRHQCNKKCCVGDCPPCEQMCGKTLSCRNHKCLSRCHRGACYPCQVEVEVRCSCGATKSIVPCGRQRATRPPKCRKPCQAGSDCHHPARAAHPCHPGACPGCRFPCRRALQCGHACEAACHDNIAVKVEETVRPAGPWEERPPTTVVKSLACPDCQAPVEVTCLGSHETAAWPCHAARPAPCGRRCGRRLPCGNHACQRDCHKVRNASDAAAAGSNCKKCESECLVARAPACPHPCPRPCHPPPCAPCTTVVKSKCHCGLTNLLRKCGELAAASAAARVEMLCCGDQCPKLLECSHRCALTCHPGPCSPTDQCRKKVKVPCACKRRREEHRCQQAAGVQVPCDQACREAQALARQANQATKEEDSEEVQRNQREAELFERRLEGGGKKRRRARRAEALEDAPGLLVAYRLHLLGLAVALAAAAAGYWML